MNSKSNKISVLEFKSVCFSYEKARPIVQNLNFDIASGESAFIYGPSGCGKTTLLNLSSGLITPQQGSVSILNSNTNELSKKQKDDIRREHIGYVFQVFNLIPYLSVQENIILPLRFSKKRRANVDGNPIQYVEELMSQLGIADLLHKNTMELSIGQQQRVAAARALIGEPDLILADEPTSALDSRNSEQLFEILIEHRSPKSALALVSHDLTYQNSFDIKIDLTETSYAV